MTSLAEAGPRLPGEWVFDDAWKEFSDVMEDLEVKNVITEAKVNRTTVEGTEESIRSQNFVISNVRFVLNCMGHLAPGGFFCPAIDNIKEKLQPGYLGLRESSIARTDAAKVAVNVVAWLAQASALWIQSPGNDGTTDCAKDVARAKVLFESLKDFGPLGQNAYEVLVGREGWESYQASILRTVVNKTQIAVDELPAPTNLQAALARAKMIESYRESARAKVTCLGGLEPPEINLSRNPTKDITDIMFQLLDQAIGRIEGDQSNAARLAGELAETLRPALDRPDLSTTLITIGDDFLVRGVYQPFFKQFLLRDELGSIEAYLKVDGPESWTLDKSEARKSLQDANVLRRFNELGSAVKDGMAPIWDGTETAGWTNRYVESAKLAIRFHTGSQKWSQEELEGALRRGDPIAWDRLPETVENETAVEAGLDRLVSEVSGVLRPEFRVFEGVDHGELMEWSRTRVTQVERLKTSIQNLRSALEKSLALPEKGGDTYRNRVEGVIGVIYADIDQAERLSDATQESTDAFVEEKVRNQIDLGKRFVEEVQAATLPPSGLVPSLRSAKALVGLRDGYTPGPFAPPYETERADKVFRRKTIKMSEELAARVRAQVAGLASADQAAIQSSLEEARELLRDDLFAAEPWVRVRGPLETLETEAGKRLDSIAAAAATTIARAARRAISLAASASTALAPAAPVSRGWWGDARPFEYRVPRQIEVGLGVFGGGGQGEEPSAAGEALANSAILDLLLR